MLAPDGARGEIRTPDLLVRSQTLYPTELRAHAYQERLPNGVKNSKFSEHTTALFCIRILIDGTPLLVRTNLPFAGQFRGRDLSRRHFCPRPSSFTRLIGRPASVSTIRTLPHDEDEADDPARRGSARVCISPAKGMARTTMKTACGGEVRHRQRLRIRKGQVRDHRAGRSKRLRIPGKDTLEIVQFSPAGELTPSRMWSHTSWCRRKVHRQPRSPWCAGQ